MKTPRREPPKSLPLSERSLCFALEEATNRNHPYLFLCVKLAGHSDAHDTRPAARVLWEQAYGLLPVRFTLLPKDGDWRNLELDNWELFSRSMLSKRRVDSDTSHLMRNHKDVAGTWHKTCKTCLELLPLLDFPKKRNECKDCRLKRLRTDAQKRYRHQVDHGCRLVRGAHFHLGVLGTPTNTGLTLQYYTRLIQTLSRNEYNKLVKRYRRLK